MNDNGEKQNIFQEMVSHFPCPAVEQTEWRGGRPGRSDAWVPLGSVGKRLVDLFIQVGQESDDFETVPKMLRQKQPARPNCETRVLWALKQHCSLTARDCLHQCRRPREASLLFSCQWLNNLTLCYLNKCHNVFFFSWLIITFAIATECYYCLSQMPCLKKWNHCFSRIIKHITWNSFLMAWRRVNLCRSA